MDRPVQATTTKLPVFEIAVSTWRYMLDNRKVFFQKLFVTMILLLLLEYFILPKINTLIAGSALLGTLLNIFILGLGYSVFAIICHRIVIKGAGSTSSFGLQTLSWREWSYFGYGILFYGAMVLIFIVSILAVSLFQVFVLKNRLGLIWRDLDFSSNILALLLISLFFFLFSRLVLVFPAVAIDQKASFAWSWRLGRGNGLRLGVLMVLPVFMFFGLTTLFEMVGSSELLSFMETLLSFIITIFEVGVLSKSYLFLTEYEKGEGITPHSP